MGPKLPLDSKRTLLAIVGAICLSVLLYALTFGWLLHKPLSIGTIRDYFVLKTARAAQLPSPKLVFFGGSNVRYGLRCELAERELGVPCVNAGFLADVGIDLMVQTFKPLLHRGDVVYIPLAYEQYFWSRDFVDTQRDAAYLFSYNRAMLMKMPLDRQLHAMFHYNIPYLASALAETVLAEAGKSRKAGADRDFGAKNLNAWGDETGHTAKQAQDYAEVLKRLPAKAPDAERFYPERYYYTQQLEAFLDWAHEHGVIVVGGLPQTVDEFKIPDEVIARIRAVYESHGQYFVDLPNHSQYPRHCFFDLLYHLNEECQWIHTRNLDPALAPFFAKPPPPTRSAS
ncbi:MAG TPA: hypothetical protein VFM56_06095 [Solimonas sp.]|jgi:hypothetical protein|nr:hypothetical protein [Solimonas sp.]